MSLRDHMQYLIAIPPLTLTLWICFLLVSKFNQSSQLSGVAMQQTAKAISTLDYAVLSVMIGMFSLALMLAWRLPSNPLAIGVSFLFLGITVYLGGIISNIWLAIAAQPAFQTVTNSFPITYNIIANFPMLMGVLGFVLIFVIYNFSSTRGRRRPIK